MRLPHAALGMLLGGSLLLGLLSLLMARRPQRSSPAPSASPLLLTAPPREKKTKGGSPLGPVPSPSPKLPASAYAPIIDMPAEPPPVEGSGDDFIESGLPRAVFDSKVALEAEAPSEAKLAALEVSLGHKIAPEAREAVEEAFRRQDDAAGSAIGYYRLHAIAEDEALGQIARAREKYEVEAARALGASREAFVRAFGPSR